MSLKLLARQYTTCLAYFRGPGILGATGLTYALTVMGGRFKIFCKPLLSTFYSSGSLLHYLANEAVVPIYLYDSFACL
jgi:hypothetical protein